MQSIICIFIDVNDIIVAEMMNECITVTYVTPFVSGNKFHE